MHQPMQGAGAQVARYDRDAKRRGRDAHTEDAIDCICGHGPVISESVGARKVRVICCYCWRKTTPRVSMKSALSAWNSGKAVV
jgi:hypothetical protein